MAPRRTGKRVAAVALLVLALAGCGGSNLTTEDYVAELEAACQAHRQRMLELGKSSIYAFVDPVADVLVLDESPDELAEVMKLSAPLRPIAPKLLASVELLADETSDLRPPVDSDEIYDAAEEWPGVLESIQGDLEELIAALDANDAALIQEWASSTRTDTGSAHYLIDRIPARSCSPEPL